MVSDNFFEMEFFMTEETNIHRESRLAKLRTLQEMGYNPYPYVFQPNAYAADLQKKYEGILTIVQSSTCYLEITDIGASKGFALEFLKKYLCLCFAFHYLYRK